MSDRRRAGIALVARFEGCPPDFPALIRAYDAIEDQVRAILMDYTPNQLGALVSYSFGLYVGWTDVVMLHNAQRYRAAAHAITATKMQPQRRLAEAILYLS